ncbi:MAG: response regulator [Bacteroidales bacterium]
MEDQPIYQWARRHILVVEDDESSAYLLSRILQQTGARVYHISDGKKAVDYVREHPDTDLVLMDIHLPEKDGFTATREIKAISERVVVIAQTGYAFSVEKREAKKAGCDGFLTKPLHPKLLLKELEFYLA